MPNDNMQKDLVLSINEYSYVLDETKGHVSCLVGPTKMSLSQSDTLVNFNSRNKRFEPCSYSEAKHLFTIVPENWYCILKNPAKDNRHPTPGASNSLPDIVDVGRKINIQGPGSFALYPGQMAKVIKGHSLRSNQYLLARVYEASEANTNRGEVVDADGNKVEAKETQYVNGQILVIKGTEISFYIPPTGIEVIPIDNNDTNGYVRDAITLERLEYCILKDEDGEKRYVHGPDVVFPKPTESFVGSPKGGYIFRAIELSPISGIYVKVIAEYTDEKGKLHPIGEELFITGKDQMIYYPRPEHAVICYDNKMMHHAIAIPEGEGRYIMNRLTGEIVTVKGPQMYLPDPRTEVVVKRKLTPRQCELWYPGNMDVLEYNLGLNEKSVEKQNANKAANLDFMAFSASNSLTSTLANLEAKANISRGTSYTKPRTITLDNRFEGVVTLDVWTGYAVNVVSKDGTRKTVCGPQTVMLDYDQTLEVLELSTGKPKTTDSLISTVFLKHENNKVTDVVNVETKDLVRCTIKVSYLVDFLPEHQMKWFSVDNYIKLLCDRQRSIMKRAVKKYGIEEFYNNYMNIIRDIAIDAPTLNEETSADEAPQRIGRFFSENGMLVHDCEVMSISIDRDIENMLISHQHSMVEKELELSVAARKVDVAKKLAEADKITQDLRAAEQRHALQLDADKKLHEARIKKEIMTKQLEIEEARRKAEADAQVILDAIHEAELARKEKDYEMEMSLEHERAAIETAKQEAYAETIAHIMESISPDLVAALGAKSNTELASALAHAVGPYAIAGDESIADTTNKLVRGLPFESVLKQIRPAQTDEN